MRMKILKKNIATLMIGLILLASGSFAHATLINVSIQGVVDDSGASVGGVSAPLGSVFSLDMLLDDTGAAGGIYGISALSYTTIVGTYNTVTAWTPLTAIGSGAAMSLSTGGFLDPGEHLLIGLSNFGLGSLFNDALSWNGAAISGDIIVRGIDGFASLDHLSGTSPFTGTLSISTASASAVPTPATLSLFLVGLACLRLRNRAAR